MKSGTCSLTGEERGGRHDHLLRSAVWILAQCHALLPLYCIRKPLSILKLDEIGSFFDHLAHLLRSFLAVSLNLFVGLWEVLWNAVLIQLGFHLFFSWTFLLILALWIIDGVFQQISLRRRVEVNAFFGGKLSQWREILN